MAKVHDKFVVELAEVIKGYGNPPDVEDPFCLSEFYRFYEIPNVCISADNFTKMRPLSDFTEENVERGRWEDVPHKTVEHGEVVTDGTTVRCSVCRHSYKGWNRGMNFCPNCGADMRMEADERFTTQNIGTEEISVEDARRIVAEWRQTQDED